MSLWATCSNKQYSAGTPFKKFGLQTGCGFTLKHALIEHLERIGLERLVTTKMHVLNKRRCDIILHTQPKDYQKGSSPTIYCMQLFNVASQELSPSSLSLVTSRTVSTF